MKTKSTETRKNYEKPEISIVILACNDNIVTVSGVGEDGASIPLEWLLGG